jgi:hypothetical protein
LFRKTENGQSCLSFAPNPPPEGWRFGEAKGIGIYTDFYGITTTGELTPTGKLPETHLSWQAHWYHRTTSESPSSYSFIQADGDTKTWADLFLGFWQDDPDGILRTIACDAPLPVLYRLYLLMVKK